MILYFSFSFFLLNWFLLKVVRRFEKESLLDFACFPLIFFSTLLDALLSVWTVGIVCLSYLLSTFLLLLDICLECKNKKRCPSLMGSSDLCRDFSFPTRLMENYQEITVLSAPILTLEMDQSYKILLS